MGTFTKPKMQKQCNTTDITNHIKYLDRIAVQFTYVIKLIG